MNAVAEEELKEESRHESDFEISRFVEDQAKIVMDVEERNVEDTIKYIMRELRRNTYDFFEVSAVGKLNCQAAEKVSKSIHRWVIIDCVKAKRWVSSDDCWLYYRFKRSHDFYDKFKEKKDYILKARQRAKEEKEYAELKALRERNELVL